MGRSHRDLQLGGEWSCWILTYEEALALATKNMAPLGYFPWEIKDAALKMLGEECAKEYVKIYGEVK